MVGQGVLFFEDVDLLLAQFQLITMFLSLLFKARYFGLVLTQLISMFLSLFLKVGNFGLVLSQFVDQPSILDFHFFRSIDLTLQV